jgi:hypothetical protein
MAIEYIQLGLPAHDRLWSGDDMAKAAHVLSEVANQDAGQLPRHRSEHSGAVFSRITSTENLELFRNDTLPLDARMPQAATYLGSINKILKLYITGILKNSTSGSEIIELAGTELRMEVVILELVDEFLPTLDKNDPAYKIRMAGLEKMKRGLATTVAGTLQMLTETETYRTSERVRLLGYLKETLPDIVPRLTDDSRSEFMIRLETMSRSDDLKELQPALGELHAAIRGLADGSKSP